MKKWQIEIYEIIFEAETPAGKAFDVALIWAILVSVLAVMLESVQSIEENYGFALRTAEWIFTGLFTAEYITRIMCSRQPLKYIFSFFGVIDLLAVIPTYISLIYADSHYLLVIRAVRLLRVFRIFKLSRYVGEANVLILALKASRQKISVFLATVAILVILVGTVIYIIEGGNNGFNSIPASIYWAVVTLTTVGYGDIVPQTVLGRVLAGLVMIMGYGIIAVPTGIVTVEIANANKEMVLTKTCRSCTKEGHAVDAVFCKYCGSKI